MLVCYLLESMFYTVFSGVSGQYVHRLCTRKKNLCTWKKNSQHSQNASHIPHFGYIGSTSRSWHPNLLSEPHVKLYFDFSFFMGSILWLNQNQGLFIMCAPDTDVTGNTYSKCSWSADHQKKWLSFNLVEVHRPAILYFASRDEYLS